MSNLMSPRVPAVPDPAELLAHLGHAAGANGPDVNDDKPPSVDDAMAAGQRTSDRMQHMVNAVLALFEWAPNDGRLTTESTLAVAYCAVKLQAFANAALSELPATILEMVRADVIATGSDTYKASRSAYVAAFQAARRVPQ